MRILKLMLLEIPFFAVFFLAGLIVATFVKMNNPDCFTCGATAGGTVVFICFFALQPLIWSRGLYFRQRTGGFFFSVFTGLLFYLGAETIAGVFFANNVSMGLTFGYYANLIGVIAAFTSSILMVRGFKGNNEEAALSQKNEA